MQQKAEAMLQAGHYDMDTIRDCAEKVASHWQQLMLKMEDRLKLVNASVAFYKTSEQVWAHGYQSVPLGRAEEGNVHRELGVLNTSSFLGPAPLTVSQHDGLPRRNQRALAVS